MKIFIKNFFVFILGLAARRVLIENKPIIIGVTGSAGKTSTKEAIAHVLKANLGRDKIFVAEGNLNTEFGLPIAILGLKKPEQRFDWLKILSKAIQNIINPYQKLQNKILVLEYGADAPGDIKKLTKIAPPNISVVTIVGSAHTINFKNLEGVAKEKSELVKALPKNGIAFLNEDDKFVKKMAKYTSGQVYFVSGVGLELSKEIAKQIALKVFLINEKNVKKALESWTQPPGRLQILSGINDSILIDDTYNANPPSTLLALNELKKQSSIRGSKRIIAVLGDMLELGEEESKVHKGSALAAIKIVDILITVGPRYEQTKVGKNFHSPLEASKYLLGIIKKGDLILLKGSQSMRIEIITKALLKNSVDSNRLVRQSKYWINKHYKTP